MMKRNKVVSRLVSLFAVVSLLVGAADCSGDTSGDATGDAAERANGKERTSSSVETELDLAQPFAEHPSFEGELGPLALDVQSDRRDFSAIPLNVTLTNTTSSDVTDVRFTVKLVVQEGEVMPTPDQDLVRSVTASQGGCEELDASSSTTTVNCALETISPAADANVQIVVSGAFRLSVTMSLDAAGG
jgi:hypothetical protein